MVQFFFVLVRGSSWEISSKAVLAICKQKSMVSFRIYGNKRHWIWPPCGFHFRDWIFLKSSRATWTCGGYVGFWNATSRIVKIDDGETALIHNWRASDFPVHDKLQATALIALILEISHWYFLTISLCHILVVSLRTKWQPRLNTTKGKNAAFGVTFLVGWRESRGIYWSSESTDMGREPRHVAMSAGQPVTLKPSQSLLWRSYPHTKQIQMRTILLSLKPFTDLCLRFMYPNSMDEGTAFEVYSHSLEVVDFSQTYIISMLIRLHCTGPFLKLFLGGLVQSLVSATNLFEINGSQSFC